MVERSLSMREVAGSMPAFSSRLFTADTYSAGFFQIERISTDLKVASKQSRLSSQ